MELRLLIEKIKLALQKRNKGNTVKKSREAWLCKGYNNHPLVTAVVQTHNKSLQIKHVLPVLREYKGIEIIVIDDGSSLEHTESLAKELTGANEFLVRANDLYENITYDRVLRMANGKYVALLQDDDDYSSEWISRGVELLEQHPEMVILGGKDGVDLKFEADTHYAHGGDKMNSGDFCFVVAVNRAPMWINRELYMQHLKHINEDFIPFQFDDYEICCRAWLCGLQVGWYDAGFRSLSAGGMRLWNNLFTKQQSERNGHLLYELYADKIEEIRQRVGNGK